MDKLWPTLPHFYLYGEPRSHCAIRATRRTFSSTSKYEESEFNSYIVDAGVLTPFYGPKFYANGDCEGNEGYVSILFHRVELLSFLICRENIEVNFTVAVIDATGDERFRQSLSYATDVNSCDFQAEKFGLDRFLKRETLTNDPEELLPDDCLTVYVEFDFSLRSRANPLSEFKIDKTIVTKDGARSYLNLDSTFGRELRKISDFFKFASDSSMSESKTRHVYIPAPEIGAFFKMLLILKEAKTIEFNSFHDVCEMYTVADKYCIQSMVENSKQIMKSFFRINDETIVEDAVKSIPYVLRLAEKHDDESLKEMIFAYLGMIKKIKTSDAKKCVYDFEEHIKEKLETDWICEHISFEHLRFYRLSRMRDNATRMEYYN